MTNKFSIIIPNYNSEKWIRKCLDSILEQTYLFFEVIIVDDLSTDNSVQIIKEYINLYYDKIKLIELKEKRYNGGTRNVGIENATGDYIMFLDCDDWLYSNIALMCINEAIKTSQAELIRLPYQAYTKSRQCKIPLKEKTLEELARTVFVAPWTKCIKRNKIVKFPENTLLEDIVQHIEQIDNIDSIGYVNIPIVVWNRTNEEAISSDVAKYDKTSKRYSSVYRNLADLLDLKCKHDYCEKVRLEKVKNYEDIIARGDIFGLINGRNAL